MNIIEIIEKKKIGQRLTKEEINFWIDGVIDKSIADYQTSALLMAICINKIDDEESFYLTDAMLNSGEKISLDDFYDISIDKHSTGGVGDSTSFIVLPVLASLGYKSAKFSGRSLGFTGGTLDKLESINGLKISLDKDKFFKQVNEVGIAIAGQTQEICPADKILYALRDVTSTVDNVGLIASSIMSKKLASGAKNIVLDVKYGEGAFMKKEDDAKALAELMVKIVKKANRNISALITSMQEPLDEYIGNSLEIYGALKVLDGDIGNNLAKVSISLCVSLLESMGEDDAYNKVIRVIKEKQAKQKFIDMIKAQGGDVDLLIRKESLLNSKFKVDIPSKKTGYIKNVHPLIVSECVMMMGGGRLKVEDKIDLYCGIHLNVKVGDYIKEGETVATLYYNISDIEKCINTLYQAFEYSEVKVNKTNLIYEKVN